MASKSIQQGSQTDLRLRAIARLTGHQDSGDIRADTRANSSAALGALYELASSPATTADALALLHELQVHQVELEMQDEELQRSRAELEASLARQVQIYDLAPFGYFTVDGSTTLTELNLAGARLLGCERETLLGQRLDSFLTPESGRALHSMLTRITHGGRAEGCDLDLAARDGETHGVHACANTDSTGGRFLVALSDSAR